MNRDFYGSKKAKWSVEGCSINIAVKDTAVKTPVTSWQTGKWILVLLQHPSSSSRHLQ